MSLQHLAFAWFPRYLQISHHPLMEADLILSPHPTGMTGTPVGSLNRGVLAREEL